MKHGASPLLVLALAAAAAQAGPQRVTIRGPQNVGATVQFQIEIFNPTATPLLCRYESTFSLNRTPFPGPVGQVTVQPNSLERREASRLHENRPWAFDADVDCEEVGATSRSRAAPVAAPAPLAPAPPPPAVPPGPAPLGPIATRPYSGPSAGEPARVITPPVAVRPAPAPAPAVVPPPPAPPSPPAPAPVPAPAPAPQARGGRPAEGVVDSLDQLKAPAAARAQAGRDCAALDELMDHRAAKQGEVRVQQGKKFECQDGRWRPLAP